MTNNDLKQIGSLIDQKLAGTEARLKEEITISGKMIKDDVGDFVENTLMPMINERFDEIDERFDEKADKTDIDRIERKLDKVLDTNIDHEHRIKDIESIPAIAHQLKHRKSK